MANNQNKEQGQMSKEKRKRDKSEGLGKDEGKKVKKDKPTKKDVAKAVKTIPDGVVVVKHGKAFTADRPINPYTGTRFRPNSSQQTAFDIIYKGAKAGKNVEAIREDLAKYRKENGNDHNLDSGYFPFVVASHLEFFQVVSKAGVQSIKVIKEPKIDKEAIAAKEAKIKEAREKRSSDKGGKKSKKSAKGEKGSEKKHKKHRKEGKDLSK